MNEIQKFEQYLLINIPIPDSETDVSPYVKEILNGEYEVVLKNEFFSSIILNLIDENIEENISINNDNCKNWFYISVASFLYFIQSNWTGPFKKEDIDSLLRLRRRASTYLSFHDQFNENVSKSELLYFAKIILNNDQLHKHLPSSLWWLFRVNHIHQLILEEASENLFNKSENLIKQISISNLINNDSLRTLFNIEVAQFYFYYRRIQSSEIYLEDARAVAKLSFDLEGALGKRTKYQQQAKPQLYLNAKVDKDLFPHRVCEILPKVINLSDDLRLEKVEFLIERKNVELGCIEEAIIMTKFFQLKLSQPNDQLTDEEIIPYLNNVIDNTKNWSLRMSALFQRCILESNNKRTIERSLSQIEYLIDQLNISKTFISFRLDLFFASGMNPIWLFKKHLANMMLNLGMVKGALDHYLSLSLWEDVIICYTILEKKYKAAEIIQQELSKKPTVKLWCLLGDVTEKVEYYETAWKLSGEKSSRAQRHWGLYYYSKKNYKESVVHLKLSIELNNIQESVLERLGFAAMQIKDWKVAASAYRKYCVLEQSNFEVWNNLAKVYIKLGDKRRAWYSLQDAIKCNFNKWEVWGNLMVVSIDLGHFSEVIHCYHRIMDLKGVYVDIEILSILSKAIINNVKDFYENPSRKYLKNTLELFGRLTASISNNSDIWILYAELTVLKNNGMEYQKAIQYFQRAYGAAISNPRSFKSVEDVNKVLGICLRLAEISMSYLTNCSNTQKKVILVSVKLCLQSVIKKVEDLIWEDQSGITENFIKVKENLKIVLDLLIEIQNKED
ncbi:PREDICTED: tetratricopeptide repeat protein 27 [Ceratosolen solmsi marchali]|uniref:Tetratricopeptide repeat protein 27 n=1 Tax=Ceratosolen solmsi marchali TaxID=326594 RepID=A0AAJ6YFQ2_9HYME|nr:PREDICTED: tetratricopeptide repeat protein 27 [Ceratosolen solmsi marchali]